MKLLGEDVVKELLQAGWGEAIGGGLLWAMAAAIILALALVGWELEQVRERLRRHRRLMVLALTCLLGGLLLASVLAVAGLAPLQWVLDQGWLPRWVMILAAIPAAVKTCEWLVGLGRPLRKWIGRAIRALIEERPSSGENSSPSRGAAVTVGQLQVREGDHGHRVLSLEPLGSHDPPPAPLVPAKTSAADFFTFASGDWFLEYMKAGSPRPEVLTITPDGRYLISGETRFTLTDVQYEPNHSVSFTKTFPRGGRREGPLQREVLRIVSKREMRGATAHDSDHTLRYLRIEEPHTDCPLARITEAFDALDGRWHLEYETDDGERGRENVQINDGKRNYTVPDDRGIEYSLNVLSFSARRLVVQKVKKLPGDRLTVLQTEELEFVDDDTIRGHEQGNPAHKLEYRRGWQH